MADSPVAELTVDAHAVLSLLFDAAPQLAGLPLRLVAEGWDNTIWRLGAELAVRIPRRELAAQLIVHEQRTLPTLGGLLLNVGVLTPIPQVNGRPSANFPWSWSVVPWIDGEPVLGHARSHNDRWAATLAAALVALHQPAPADAPENAFRGNPLAMRASTVNDRLRGQPAASALRKAWDAGLNAQVSRERVWLQGDLHPGNLLTRNQDLVALIDFGDVTAGDPAYDLAVIWLVFSAEGRRTFIAATRDRYDDDTWTRARAWAAFLTLTFLTQSDDRPEYLAVGTNTATELALGH